MKKKETRKRDKGDSLVNKDGKLIIIARNDDGEAKHKEEATIPKKLDIGNDSMVNLVNREDNNNFKKGNNFKEKIDERLKSIERSMIYTQDNGLVELVKR